VADRIPQVANVVISNVPGPPVQLYMAGARMLTNYPTSIVVHGMALNITVQSYDKHLDFGLMADAAGHARRAGTGRRHRRGHGRPACAAAPR
jgi:diacylglycerol O-acyltransferase